MNDLLLGLARRVLYPPAIRPRLASRFEAEGIAPSRWEQAPETLIAQAGEVLTVAAQRPDTALPSHEPITPIRPDPVLPSPVPVTAASYTSSFERNALPPTVALPQAFPGSPFTQMHEAPTVQSAPATPPLALATPAHSPSLHDTRPVERLLHRERIEQQTTHRETIERRVERLRVSTPNTAVPQPPQLSMPEARATQPQPLPAAPRIEISIGRIEIIAQSPAPAGRREEPPPRLPAKSLEEYLSERDASTGRRS
ncbi:hypothetical protein OH720_15625 [Pseudomonas sp. WJP1]|uniref:hypothetical protein n=1 Tax=Pseudomonas sp. WJP1 TaxID=2986947 RepID=UPI00234AF925|nr:hypothetical protein [Pseudomonas sp. WJP1]WCM54374.1 hypothetical protein OH720_15625 [Pseudomonas sp. WJP1]